MKINKPYLKNKTKKFIVLGGGFAGVEATIRLRKIFK
jgi:NADH dehydrogenase FAD-containing subunit